MEKARWKEEKEASAWEKFWMRSAIHICLVEDLGS